MKLCMISALALLLTAAAIPKAAGAMSTTVNCTQGQKIGTALAAGFDEITVNGTCNEDVEVRQDDVTIQGSGSGGTVVGQLLVNGARRVVVQNLAVQGSGAPGSHGVLAVSGANVAIANVVIENIADGNGVHIAGASSASLDHVTVRQAGVGVVADEGSTLSVTNGSLIEDNRDGGIAIIKESDGSVANTIVRNNGVTGIELILGSSLALADSTVEGSPEGVDLNTMCVAWLDGNSISTTSTPDSSALGVLWGSTARLRGGNTLSSPILAIFLEQGATLNQRGGDVVNGPVQLQVFSNAEFRNVKITGNVNVIDHSLVRIKDQSTGATQVSLKGNTSISQASALNFLRDAGERQVRVVGDITCADTESSIAAPSTIVTISGKTKSCTGYNYATN